MLRVMSHAPERLQAAIDEHAENVARFKRGEITPDQFRPLRLAMGVYAQLAHVIHTANQTRRAVHLVEAEELGVTHGEVGAYLLGIWGLPLDVVETAAFHHTPSSLTEGSLELLAAFHTADALVEAAAHGLTEESIDIAFLERAGALRELPRWRSIAAEALRIGSA